MHPHKAKVKPVSENVPPRWADGEEHAAAQAGVLHWLRINSNRSMTATRRIWRTENNLRSVESSQAVTAKWKVSGGLKGFFDLGHGSVSETSKLLFFGFWWWPFPVYPNTLLFKIHDLKWVPLQHVSYPTLWELCNGVNGVSIKTICNNSLLKLWLKTRTVSILFFLLGFCAEICLVHSAWALAV